MVETDVVGPAGCPVLHVAQVGVPVDQHVSAAEQRRRVRAAACPVLCAGQAAYLQSREAL